MERQVMDERTVALTAETEEGQETRTFSTVRFGEVTVTTERMLEFPRGLVGMPEARNFVFLHQQDGHGPFFWLQSADDPNLAFVVCEPHVFFPEYQVPLTNEEQKFLQIKQAEDGVVCLILVVPGDPKKITANLRGPLVVNVETRVGMQVVLTGEDYPTKALVFTQEEEGDAECSS